MAAPELDDHIEEHSSFIRTPKQLLIVVFLAFAIPLTVLILMATLATSLGKFDKDHPGMTDEAIAQRIKPVGQVVLAEAGAAPGARSGEAVYKETSQACHAAGVLNAPKLGDKATWSARIAHGLEVMTQNAIKGIRQMPPRGGNPELTDAEVERAVVFMANQSGASFKEPPTPAPAEKPTAAAAAETPAAPAAPAPAPTAAAAAPAGAAAPAAAPAADKTAAAGGGKAIYDKICMACHATGLAGSPKAGDKAAWEPRLKEGMDAVYAIALKGKGAMPPKGGATQLSDAEVKSAVDYMVSLVK
jgi:cytochrome c5